MVAFDDAHRGLVYILVNKEIPVVAVVNIDKGITIASIDWSDEPDIESYVGVGWVDVVETFLPEDFWTNEN